MYNEFPGWAASDEIEFAMTYFTPAAFNPPILQYDLALISASVKPNCGEMQIFFALREGHWIGIEVIRNATLLTCRVVVLQVPQRDQQFWTQFAEEFIVPPEFRPVIIIDTNQTRPGMCGWELVHVDLHLPPDFQVPQARNQIIEDIIHESNQAWRLAGAPPMVRSADYFCWLVGSTPFNLCRRPHLEEWKVK